MPFEIIAELHPQHGGDKGVLREMIRQAKAGGADVAKIQLYDAPTLLGADRWNYLQFTETEACLIKTWCDQEEIEFMASVFDSERLAWCEAFGVSRYKIASRTVTGNVPLCQAILDKGKETFISLGAWREPQMPFGQDSRLKYLYCKAEYPALLEHMADFPADFTAAGLAGYSDHTLGINMALLSVARGAQVIEKHFTLNKASGKPTEKAHVCSMTMDELRLLRDIGGGLYRTRQALARNDSSET